MSGLGVSGRGKAVTPEEKYIFDLTGYLVVKGALSRDEVDALNRVADEAFPYDKKGSEGEFSLLSWGKPFKDLIDHPNMLPYLIELIGPTVRLDHDYCIFMNKGEKRGGLHGGIGGDHWYRYRNGELRNGLTVMIYFLTDGPAGTGGFACVPGSHKSNFSTVVIPDEVRSFEVDRPYVVQPEVEAGDVLIFTEALVHGTMDWTAEHERRSLLYKYSPGHSSWALNWYDFDLGELTPQQERLLAPPSMQGHRPVVEEQVSEKNPDICN